MTSFYVVRVKENVRAKPRAVNSVFLVQLRKSPFAAFRASAINQAMHEALPPPLRYVVACRPPSATLQKSATVVSRIVHKTCTGNAETHCLVISLF
jgi:hypothetical protein